MTAAERKARLDRVTECAITLHAIARKLDVRAGLQVAEIRPERAAEWAGVARTAETLLTEYLAALHRGSLEPRACVEFDLDLLASAGVELVG